MEYRTNKTKQKEVIQVMANRMKVTKCDYDDVNTAHGLSSKIAIPPNHIMPQ